MDCGCFSWDNLKVNKLLKVFVWSSKQKIDRFDLYHDTSTILKFRAGSHRKSIKNLFIGDYFIDNTFFVKLEEVFYWNLHILSTLRRSTWAYFDAWAF